MGSILGDYLCFNIKEHSLAFFPDFIFCNLMFLVGTFEPLSNLTACIILTRMTIFFFFYQFVNMHACAFMVSYDCQFDCLHSDL